MVVSWPEDWQLTGSGAAAYERFQVPSLFAPLARVFLERATPRPGDAVLDVACGTGIVARLAAGAVGAGGRVVGIDLNEVMLEVARQSAPPGDRRLAWRHGDASALPCADARFDLVLCQQGLQFVPDKAGALAEMHRVLRPGGRLGLCVWRSIVHSPCNAACLAALEPRLGAATAGRLRGPFALGDPELLAPMIARAGFQEIEIQQVVVTRRMLAAEASIPGHLDSTPLGPAVAALDQAARAAVVREIAEALRPYRDTDGLSVPQGTLIALARKPVS